MNRHFLLIALVFLICHAKAQFLTQSAEGKGAVLLPLNGFSIGADIGKSEITIGVNNYAKPLKQNNTEPFQNWFFGGNLAVGNSSGIGNLFKSGDIVGGGNLLGFMGFNINNNQKIIDKWNTGRVAALNLIEYSKTRKQFLQYRSDILNYFMISLREITDNAYRNTQETTFMPMITKADDNIKLIPILAAIKSNNDPKFAEFRKKFDPLKDAREKVFQKSYSMDDVTKLIDTAFNDFVDNITVKRWTPFIFGGIDARSFSLNIGLNTTSLASTFKDTLYRGGQFGIGTNFQWGTWWFGITYAYIAGDNFSNLTAKEYILRTTDTVRNQALISEKKITGYNGKYGYIDRNELNIDLVKEFKLSDTARLITSLYYRGTVNSRDTSYLKNISNIGLGIYFLGNKSKFIGGLYIELPDIHNNIEKAKPEADRNIRPTMKKLTFGITTKFSLSSIFGFINRPRKPD